MVDMLPLFPDRRAAEFKKKDLVICALTTFFIEWVDSGPYRRPISLDLFANAAD